MMDYILSYMIYIALICSVFSTYAATCWDFLLIYTFSDGNGRPIYINFGLAIIIFCGNGRHCTTY